MCFLFNLTFPSSLNPSSPPPTNEHCILSLGYKLPFGPDCHHKNSLKYLFCVQNMQICMSWTSKWELAMHFDHLLQLKGTHDIIC
jgi:hypothetical protein